MNRAERRSLERKGNSKKKLGLSVLAATSLVSGNVPLLAPGAFGAPAACSAGDEGTLIAKAADLSCSIINVTANIDLTEGAVLVNHDVTIQGDYTIDAQTNSRIFIIEDGYYDNVENVDVTGDLSLNSKIDVTIKDLTLTNGNASGGFYFDGGAIYANYNELDQQLDSEVSLTLDGTTISNNYATEDGGAIYLDWGSLTTLGGTTFTGNMSQSGGGAIYLDNGNLFVSGNTTFSSNGYLIGEGEVLDTHNNNGGAVYIENGDFIVQTGATATFNNNGAAFDGGAIYIGDGNITVQSGASVSFTENFAGDQGGAVFAEGGTFTVAGTASFTNNGFIKNSSDVILEIANEGGAIYIYDINFPELIISGTATFTGNQASGDGGAIYVDGGDITISGTASFTNNKAGDDGGAIYSDDDDIIISGTATFTGNEALTDGGAIYTEGGGVEISGTATFTNNYADGEGGAIYVDSNDDLYISGNATFTGNDADNGGAVYLDNGGDLVITTTGSATFTSNTANEDGGALYFAGGGFGAFITSGIATFNGNTAGDDGGAIWSRGNSVFTGGISTFTNNSANSDGGAIYLGVNYLNQGGVFGEGDAVVTFAGNSANGDGGAIHSYVIGSGQSSKLSFIDNNADGNGGAIIARSAYFVGDYFGQNSADQNGGAIYVDQPSYIQNSTFFGNSAGDEGGAIFAFANNSEVVMSSFVNNSADGVDGDAPGQSIYTTGTFKIFGNIFASNQSDLAHLGEGGGGAPEFIDLGGNLSSSAADEGELVHETSKIVTYAELTLAAAPAVDPNYPNSTRTIQISTDSLAADAIDVAELAASLAQLNLAEGGLTEIDQRGALRTMKFDAGAYEAGDSTYQAVVPIIEVAPKVVLPAAPQRVAVKKSGAGALRIEWTQPTTPGTGKIIRYEIWRNGKKIATISANARTYRDAGLDSSQSYTYRIVTVGTQGRSIKSVNSQSVFPRR